MRRIPAIVTTVVLLAAAAACSVSVGGGSISPDELTKQVSAALEAEVGQTPEGLDCPEAMDAKVDATATCTLPVGEDVYDVAVTVTSIEDDNAKFDVAVADTPNE